MTNEIAAETTAPAIYRSPVAKPTVGATDPVAINEIAAETTAPTS